MMVLLSVEDLLNTEKVSSAILEGLEFDDYMLDYVVDCIKACEAKGYTKHSVRLEFIADIDESQFNNLPAIEKMRVLKQVVSLLERKFVGFHITSSIGEFEALENIIISFFWGGTLIDG